MATVSTSPISLRRKPPQREEKIGHRHRINERDRDLVLRLCEENVNAPGATSVVVAELMRCRHGRHIPVDDIDRILHEDRREWRQRALALAGHVEAGLREYARIPRENRAERQEAA